jgi:hypothetical protein
MRRLTTALLSLVLLATGAQAQTAKEKYELSERCGKRAAEMFARGRDEPSRNEPSAGYASYENHYNSRLNKCFYLGSFEDYGRSIPIAFIRLLDLNDNREIGAYYFEWRKVIRCTVQEQRCQSEREWRALIKPFMED